MTLGQPAVVVLLGVSFSPPAEATPAPTSESAARVYVAGAGEGEPALAARLHDLLDQDLPGLRVESAPFFRGDEPLRTDVDVTAPAAWLVLEATHARVRAAGAARDRFVFRDLEVSQPLTEFDRERLGQTLKAALGTLVAGGPGVMSRADAAAASGVAMAPTKPPPVVTDVAPAVSPPVVASSSTARGEPHFRLGAFYQAHAVGNGFVHGPGLLATLSGSGLAYDPAIWLTGGYDLQRDFGNQLASAEVAALWMRVGLDVRLGDKIRVGAGMGFDRQTNRVRAQVPNVTFEPGHDSTLVTVGRLVARAVPTRVAGIDVSLSAFLDISRSIDRTVDVKVGGSQDVSVTVYHEDNVRPGLSLDLWWR